jgi:uncharacterized protein
VPAAPKDTLASVVTSRPARITIRLAAVVIVVLALWYAFRAFVNIRTNVQWYDSVDAGSVYDRLLGAQVLLFLVFGVLMALAVAASLVLVIRQRPRWRPDPRRHKWRRRFLRAEPRLRVWLIVVLSAWLGIRIGSRAASRALTYLAWRNTTSWHQTDPQFHRDISYYIDVLPFHRMVVNYLSSIVLTCLVVTLVAAYLYGALRFRVRGRERRVTPALVAQVSVLLGLYLLLKGASYWLLRYSLTTSNRGPVTGLSYTDVHAVLPARTILTVVAVVCALLLFANARMRRLRYAAASLAVMVVAAVLIGNVWPSLIYKFREQPSAASLDKQTIERNQAATKQAFTLGNAVRTQKYGTNAHLSSQQFLHQALNNTQVRVLDPNEMSPTFNVKQQQTSYYMFKSTLDMASYPLGGQSRDVAIAVRELKLSGIPRSSWTNRHLVYTHGYGVVAAPTNEMDPKTGTPVFINGGIPPKNQIPVSNPQIYFGQNSPPYSIVGQPPGSTQNIEFNFPSSGSSSASGRTTYHGDGGVPIGSRFDRLLWAVKLHDPNIFFSSDINSASQLLWNRNPRARVAQVAPWLTLDGDVYPAVANGHVYWVVDGYTSSSNYPYSQETNLRNATTSSLTSNGASVAQPSRSVNYLRNSVKAVVDAYTGKVTLYEWDQQAHPDYALKVWEKAFPGVVKSQSQIPSALLPHLRYPQDLFDVQRLLVSKYHVTDPGDFYAGSDFWKVPTDPTIGAQQSLNALGGVVHHSAPSLASAYMSLSPVGDGPQDFALSTPLVSLNYRDLEAFLSVDTTPGPDYGKFTVLRYPAGSSVASPSQVQNEIESDNQIARALTLQRGGNSRVVLGNLLTIPIGGKILYVEPVYTQSQGGGGYPIMRHVIAIYGNGEPAFDPSLSTALKQAYANEAKSG